MSLDPPRSVWRLGEEAGVTLVELMLSLAVVVIVGALGVPYLLSSLPTYRANGAARHVVGDFRLARTLAVERGGDVLIAFDAPAADQYTLAYDTHPAPPHNDHQLTAQDEVIKVTNLPNLYQGVVFTRYGPSPPGSSPSGGALPDDGVSFQSNTAIFNPDATARAGSLYLRPARDAGVTRRTERCVAVAGSTARARAYRWTGTEWE